jgi:NADH:ubiquinone oxidoreductase subunit E
VKPALVRRAAWAAGVLIIIGIALLVADWIVAANRAPKDDAIIAALQEQVKADAAVSQTLDAEQKRITDARLARRARDRAVGWVLVVCSAIFLASAKHLLAVRRCKPVDINENASSTPAAMKKHQRRKTRTDTADSSAADTVNVSYVDQAVAQIGGGKEAAIPLLQAIQQHYRYLPSEALLRLCDITQITPAEIVGTSTFYGQFRQSPVGRHMVRVCHGTACHVAGARQISDELRRYLQIPEDTDTDPARMFTLEEVACLGCCSLAPVMMVDERTEGRLTASAAEAVLEELELKETV